MSWLFILLSGVSLHVIASEIPTEHNATTDHAPVILKSILKKESKYSSQDVDILAQARNNLQIIDAIMNVREKSLNKLNEEEQHRQMNNIDCSRYYILKSKLLIEYKLFDSLPADIRKNITQDYDALFSIDERRSCCCLPSWWKEKPAHDYRAVVLKIVEDEHQRCLEIEKVYVPQKLAPSKKQRTSSLIIDDY